jgi:hypothetical protein
MFRGETRPGKDNLQEETKAYLFGVIDKALKIEPVDFATVKDDDPRMRSLRSAMRAIEAAGKEAFAACLSPQAVDRLSEEIEAKLDNPTLADEDSAPGILRRLAREREAAIRAKSDEFFRTH